MPVSFRVRAACVAIVITGAAAPSLAQMFTERTYDLFPLQQEYTNQVTSVDIDGDGDLDLIWANGGGYSAAEPPLRGRVYVNRLNEPLGVFVDESDARLPNLLGIFRDVQAGDVDGDGDWDLVFVQDFVRPPLLLINNGAGFFTDESVARLPAMSLSSSHAQFADVDNDGDLDLFFCNGGAFRQTAGVPQLFLNNGAGFYVDAPSAMTPQATITGQMECTFGDLDGDFDLDLIISSLVGQSQLWRNDGTGKFTRFQPFNGGSVAYSHDLGDIDGDGDFDLIGVSVLPEYLERNNMPSPWTDVSSLISPNNTVDDNDSRFFDYDQDGDPDLIIATLEYGVTPRSSVERVYRNDGPAAVPQFIEVFDVMPQGADATLDLDVADFNGDGRLDVVTAQGEFGLDFQNRIYINVLGSIDALPPLILRVEDRADVQLLGGSAGPFSVRAVITDATTGDRGFEPGGIDLDVQFASGERVAIPMRWAGNAEWRGVIPSQSTCGTISYAVAASDRAGNVATSATHEFTISAAAPIVGDLDGDCRVGGSDIAILLGAWGTRGPAADLNGDHVVNAPDLAIVLGAWTG